jgi:type VI secretion system ImpA family protein
MRALSDLLRPIPGPNPSGENTRYTGVFDRIKEARREEPDLPQGIWKRERKIADWNAVVELCSDALIHQTKDLQIATWLTEGLLHTDGYPGLAGGLNLLRGLLDNFWSTVYPRSEDDESELRAVPLEWLGSRLDFALKSLPLAPEGLSWFDAERQLTSGSMVVVDSITRMHYRARVEELNSCLASLGELNASCASHFEGASPRFHDLWASLKSVEATLLSLIAETAGASQRDVEEPASTAISPSSSERIEGADDGRDADAAFTRPDTDSTGSRDQTLAKRTREQKQEAQRLDRLRRELAVSADLLGAGRIDEATARLYVLDAEFPDNEDVSKLLQCAERNLEAKRYQDAVSTAVLAARALLDKGLLEQATAVLREASSRYPDEADLQSLSAKAKEQQSAGMRRGDADPVLDHVHFTITTVSTLQRGRPFELYFWVHLDRHRRAVIYRAMRALGLGNPEDMLVKSEGPVALARGTIVSARISISGLPLDPCEKSILWSGETGCASFVISVPPTANQHQYRGVVSIRVNSCEVARMDFLLRMAGRSGRVPAKLKRHATAFASYASEDRDAVIARLQGMQKVAPWLKVFMDVVDLRSGELWEQQLRQAIRESDVFYLFWCRHARASKWVDREWRYAYRQRGLEFIDAVPLERSKNAPPPDELKTKHFNDLWIELNSKRHCE